MLVPDRRYDYHWTPSEPDDDYDNTNDDDYDDDKEEPAMQPSSFAVGQSFAPVNEALQYNEPLDRANTWVKVRRKCPTCKGVGRIFAPVYGAQAAYIEVKPGQERIYDPRLDRPGAFPVNQIECPTCMNTERHTALCEWGAGWIEQWVNLTHVFSQISQSTGDVPHQ